MWAEASDSVGQLGRSFCNILAQLSQREMRGRAFSSSLLNFGLQCPSISTSNGRSGRNDGAGR